MSPEDVRMALGDPNTIRGNDWLGDRWYYSTKWRWTAYCEFVERRLRDWVEPSQPGEL